MQKSNPDYNLVINRLHLYYNMQLFTFDINKDKNLVIQFPVFIQPYTQQPLILYQLETVPVPITYQNTQVQSYTHLQVTKPYIALNSETHISIIQQELKNLQKNWLWILLQRTFIVKHKSRYSCESMIYFNLEAETIKENCKFKFYYNKTDITPTILEIHIHACLCIYIHSYIHTHLPTYMYIHKHNIFICIHTYVHTYWLIA